MKKEKCIIFDFSKGKRADTSYSHYNNGQLDLDLKIEVMSPEPYYGCNILEFNKPVKKKDTCINKQAPSYTA